MNHDEQFLFQKYLDHIYTLLYICLWCININCATRNLHSYFSLWSANNFLKNRSYNYMRSRNESNAGKHMSENRARKVTSIHCEIEGEKTLTMPMVAPTTQCKTRRRENRSSSSQSAAILQFTVPSCHFRTIKQLNFTKIIGNKFELWVDLLSGSSI